MPCLATQWPLHPAVSKDTAALVGYFGADHVRDSLNSLYFPVLNENHPRVTTQPGKKYNPAEQYILYTLRYQTDVK